MKTHAILLVNSSEENYLYILDCLRKTQFAQFKVDWLRNKTLDEDFFKHNKFVHDVYLIDHQTPSLKEIIVQLRMHPILILFGEENQTFMREFPTGTLQLGYHQLNPFVLEHYLQLAFYLNSQYKKMLTQLEQANALLEKEIRITRNILTDINQYLLRKWEREWLQKPSAQPLTLAETGQPVGILRSNLSGDCLYCNQFFLQLLTVEEEACLGRRWFALVYEEDQERVTKAWLESHQRRSPLRLKFRMVKPDGSRVWVYCQVTFEASPRQTIIGSLATVSELTENQAIQQRLHQELQGKQDVIQAVKKANEQLQKLVNLDRVTQLANRFSFEGYFQREWQRAEQKQMPLALLIIDIDHFHQFNRVQGYAQGDQCLRQLADTFRNLLKRPRDLLARYGNDEFAVLLPDTPLEGAEVVGRQLLKTVQTLVLASAGNLSITVSIGIAYVIPTASLTSDTLIQFAEEALGRAKTLGGNQLANKTLELPSPGETDAVMIDWDNF